MNDQSPRRRPSRATIERLLSADGQQVSVHRAELHEDVDGSPLGVESVDEGAATLIVPSLELLGWTREEWDDPAVTE